jgi:hypothetical protein
MDWFPIAGLSEGWRSYLLPGFVLGALSLAYIARLTRTSLVENLRADYVRTATAKGASGYRVIGVHALRNSLIPVVTFVGVDLGALMGGAIVTEGIFKIPGIGQLRAATRYLPVAYVDTGLRSTTARARSAELDLDAEHFDQAAHERTGVSDDQTGTAGARGVVTGHQRSGGSVVHEGHQSQIEVEQRGPVPGDLLSDGVVDAPGSLLLDVAAYDDHHGASELTLGADRDVHATLLSGRDCWPGRDLVGPGARLAWTCIADIGMLPDGLRPGRASRSGPQRRVRTWANGSRAPGRTTNLPGEGMDVGEAGRRGDERATDRSRLR